MRRAIVFDAVREGYGLDQLRNPMTVGELKDILEGLEDDDMIVMSHDGGYTFGSITFSSVWKERECEDGTEFRAIDEW